MKIRAIETVPYTIPYLHPVVAASGTLDGAEHVLVRVHTDDGLVGIGDAVERSFVYGESQASIVAAIRKWIEPALVGTDPLAVEDAWHRTAWLPANNTARGAVDIALHDVRGKATGLPAWRLLGGTGTPVRVTRILSMGQPEDITDEVREAVENDGISSFKVKVGTGLKSDVARVTAVRAAAGEDATIYVDANHGWSAEEAIPVLTALLELGLALVEEPSPAADRAGRRLITRHVPVTIMADESAPTLADATRELVDGSARALSIKTTRTGFTESARLVALAEAHGARTLLGSQGDGMIGSAALVAFGSAHPRVSREPGELDYHTVSADHLLDVPLQVHDGRLTPSDRPGIGVNIDEDKLAHYRVDI